MRISVYYNSTLNVPYVLPPPFICHKGPTVTRPPWNVILGYTYGSNKTNIILHDSTYNVGDDILETLECFACGSRCSLSNPSKMRQPKLLLHLVYDDETPDSGLPGCGSLELVLKSLLLILKLLSHPSSSSIVSLQQDGIRPDRSSVPLLEARTSSSHMS